MSDNLGGARGRITIDTTDVTAAGARVAAAGQQITRSLQNINASTNQAQTGLSGLSGTFRNLTSGLGISLGIAGAVQLGRTAIASAQLATAYNRQQVAAESLAGSLSHLNELMRVYDESTGGVMDDAQLLAGVLNLQAVGFGKTADQLERFARAARGISLATGRPQDSTNQQLLFELANQTGFRLDQLGLSIVAVKARADELRAADSSLSKEMAYQNAVLDEANAKFGKLIDSAEGQATGLEKLTASWNNLGLAMGQVIGGPLNAFGEGAALLIDIQIARLKAWMAELDAYIKLLRSMGMAGPWLTTGESAFVGGSAGRDISRHSRQGSGGIVAPRFDEEQLAAIREWSEGVQEIERQAATDRLDATQQYESQRAGILRDYGKSIAREAQDFALGRLRAEQDFAKSIADIHRDAARNEQRQAADLARQIGRSRADSDERIIDARKDANERVVELEEDYTKARERAMADHRDKLMSAAGRLDAIAILEERKRFARQQGDAKEAHDDQRKDLQKQLDERIKDERKALDRSIADANEAHERQLQDAREADAQRIADMQADFELRQEREDEDRAIRLGRMAEDHVDQLAEMDRAHAERLAQIDTHAAEELTEHNKAFDERMLELGEQNKALEAEQARHEAYALEQYKAYLAAKEKVIDDMLAGKGGSHPSMADPYTERPYEWGVAPAAQSGASSVTRSSSFNGDIHVSIIGSTSMGENEMYRVARQAFVDALEEVG